MNGQVKPLTYKPKFLKKQTAVSHETSAIPEMVFANDGRHFFPCKFCCFAFADKTEQLQHMGVCNFKEDVPVALTPPLAKARKTFAKPAVPPVQTPSLNGFKKPSSQITISRKAPKPKQIQNNLVTIKKTRFSFPKIKLNPVAVVNNPRFVVDDNNTDEDEASTSNHKKDNHSKIYVPTETLSEYDVLFRRSDMTKCVICDKPVIKPQWARHLATHADEKTFGCSFCSRKFRRKDQRNVHEKTHTVPM
ncbi:hypothetical protein RN001_011202 [Aquatica leii]|uniref:C2H2-type domain-containing protein n=1 Tax=Aquatica leii TaxID=1421715 RepID=A0AAN7PAT3_9COLE|nr:hypothetical protein RN001_011202 [Aquatica leii]